MFQEDNIGKNRLIEIRQMELQLKEEEIKELNKDKARLRLLVGSNGVITVE